ncbi:hypothetical protein Hanom_Chr04g00333491 [Helianthus anomalus]
MVKKKRRKLPLKHKFLLLLQIQNSLLNRVFDYKPHNPATYKSHSQQNGLV